MQTKTLQEKGRKKAEVKLFRLMMFQDLKEKC